MRAIAVVFGFLALGSGALALRPASRDQVIEIKKEIVEVPRVIAAPIARVEAPRVAPRQATSGAGVSGIALGPGGEPAGGALVRLMRGEVVVAETRCDPWGGYRLEVAPGEYELSVEREGMQPARLPGVYLGAGERLQGLDVDLVAAGPILTDPTAVDHDSEGVIDREDSCPEGGSDDDDSCPEGVSDPTPAGEWVETDGRRIFRITSEIIIF